MVTGVAGVAGVKNNILLYTYACPRQILTSSAFNINILSIN